MNLFEKWDAAIDGSLERLARVALGRPASVAFLETFERALAEIEHRVQSMAGRRIFPFQRVTLHYQGKDVAQSEIAKSLFERRSDLVRVIRERLRSTGCEQPEALRVETIVTTNEVVADTEPILSLSFGKDLPPQPALQLEILSGDVGIAQGTFRQRVVNVGRSAEVYDENHRLLRQNHLFFGESGAGTPATVSRVHSRIVYDLDTGWYRIFDEASKFGTRIVRQSKIIEVPPSDQAGAWIRSGDEVHFGRVRLSIRVLNEATKF